MSNGCSTACQAALTSKAACVSEACSGATVTASSLLGIIENGGIIGALCPSFFTTTVTSIKTTTTPTKTSTTKISLSVASSRYHSNNESWSISFDDGDFGAALGYVADDPNSADFTEFVCSSAVNDFKIYIFGVIRSCGIYNLRNLTNIIQFHFSRLNNLTIYLLSATDDSCHEQPNAVHNDIHRIFRFKVINYKIFHFKIRYSNIDEQ
ncbi:hypothetical protein CJF31_00007663 [Rutstroemia sp. NJR-2017a BVV2]|nr:hypothetical protein CJF31_00008727 [Rutstroemia sp. NJR-2017a BVV2]PQE21825.1 hypothetical protein CJF31_00007663 [Rutstroemia sp. NJR-2017a BVV2]